jgi:hypothetical protein
MTCATATTTFQWCPRPRITDLSIRSSFHP